MFPVYEAFMSAESTGGFLNSSIKGVYRYAKLLGSGGVDIAYKGRRWVLGWNTVYPASQ